MTLTCSRHPHLPQCALNSPYCSFFRTSDVCLTHQIILFRTFNVHHTHRTFLSPLLAHYPPPRSPRIGPKARACCSWRPARRLRRASPRCSRRSCRRCVSCCVCACVCSVRVSGARAWCCWRFVWRVCDCSCFRSTSLFRSTILSFVAFLHSFSFPLTHFPSFPLTYCRFWRTPRSCRTRAPPSPGPAASAPPPTPPRRGPAVNQGGAERRG